MNLIEIKRVVQLLGPEGAAAGLNASGISDEMLAELASKANVSVSREGEFARSEAIAVLVKSFAKADLKPIEDLMQMSFEQLVDYFDSTKVSNSELLKLMKQLDFRVGAGDKRHLKKFVARQISETALFARVATRDRS